MLSCMQNMPGRADGTNLYRMSCISKGGGTFCWNFLQLMTQAARDKIEECFMLFDQEKAGELTLGKFNTVSLYLYAA